MFCDEIIEKVYMGEPEYHDVPGDFFLDCYYDMAIHLCGSYRLVLETEHYYLSVEAAGVIKLAKEGPVESIVKDGEWFDPSIHIDEGFDPWVDLEATLFVGERLLSVSEIQGGYLLNFTDFKLKLLPHLSLNEFPCNGPHDYCRVYGMERLITRKCECGGTGELIIDFVGDYGIRCNQCHLGTYANQCVCDAIDEWNNGAGLIEIGYYPEEEFTQFCRDPVEYIVVDRLFSTQLNDTLHCRSIIAKIGSRKFKISSRYAGNGKYDFCFSTLSSFNPEMWPQKISATTNGPISFSAKVDSDQGSTLVFRIGERSLSINAEKTILTITPFEWLLENTK